MDCSSKLVDIIQNVAVRTLILMDILLILMDRIAWNGLLLLIGGYNPKCSG